MKCPSCGKKIKKCMSACTKCQRQYDRMAAVKNEAVFKSKSRNPYNGGYTQQNPEENAVQYKKPFGNKAVNPDDEMFFSSNKKEDLSLQEVEFSDSLSEHDPDNNPYNGIEEQDNVPLNGDRQLHTTEFVAKNRVEFSKHRFAVELANKVEFRLIGLLAVNFSCIFFDSIIDATRLTFPIIIAYTVILLILSVVAMKTYHKAVTMIIAAVTIIYSIPFVIILTKTHLVVTGRTSMSAVELCLIHFHILAEYILCLRLNSIMTKFHDHWEAYQQKGIEYVNKEEYAIYKSNSQEN